MIRFIILTRCRTGSNLLLRCLNQNPEVHCEGELLSPKGDCYSKTEGFQFLGGARATGFKLFYCHNRHPGIVRQLEMDRELRIVHLRRQKILEAVLSRHLAHETDKWTDRPYGNIKLRLDPKDLLCCFKKNLERWRTAKTRFKTNYWFDVTYEDLIPDTQGVCDGIFGFLGAGPWEVHKTMQKQAKKEPKDYIENYDEVIEFLKKAGFAPYLGDV